MSLYSSDIWGFMRNLGPGIVFVTKELPASKHEIKMNRDNKSAR